jgi:hypothetical protein
MFYPRALWRILTSQPHSAFPKSLFGFTPARPSDWAAMPLVVTASQRRLGSAGRIVRPKGPVRDIRPELSRRSGIAPCLLVAAGQTPCQSRRCGAYRWTPRAERQLATPFPRPGRNWRAPKADYPGEGRVCFNGSDLRAAIGIVKISRGRFIQDPINRIEHIVRAAVVAGSPRPHY